MRILGVTITVLLVALVLQLSPPSEAAPRAAAAPGAATHKEVAPIRVTGLLGGAEPASFCLRADGTILVGVSGANELRVLAADGRPRSVWTLPMPAEAVHATGGAVYVAGGRMLARLDGNGTVVRKVELSTENNEGGSRIGGLAVLGRELFISAKADGGFEIWRYDLDLGGAKRILQELRGCCGRLNIAAGGETLFIAENTLHKVGRYDREGRPLGKWGSNRRGDPTSFGGCCNPMDISVGPGGDIYTAESEGIVKRFSAAEGRFIGTVGKVGDASGCKNVPLAASADGGKVYMLDVQNKQIRVLSREK